MNKKTKKRIKKVLNFILISTFSISCWEFGKKQYNYIKDDREYGIVQKEIENFKEKGYTQEYLHDKNYDWIELTNTAINYPLVQGTDNDFYISHDYKGEQNISGSIFYDAYDKPFNETCTVIYGHSMKDGTMFNNLHYFQKDHNRFTESLLTIYTKERSTRYRPLGYYVTSDDFIYKEFDNLMTKDAVEMIRNKSEYFVEQTEVIEGAHIIALYTCDYSQGDGRLIVFYIEETE